MVVAIVISYHISSITPLYFAHILGYRKNKNLQTDHEKNPEMWQFDV